MTSKGKPLVLAIRAAFCGRRGGGDEGDSFHYDGGILVLVLLLSRDQVWIVWMIEHHHWKQDFDKVLNSESSEQEVQKIIIILMAAREVPPFMRDYDDDDVLVLVLEQHKIRQQSEFLILRAASSILFGDIST